jgi:hypothetical protein
VGSRRLLSCAAGPQRDHARRPPPPHLAGVLALLILLEEPPLGLHLRGRVQGTVWAGRLLAGPSAASPAPRAACSALRRPRRARTRRRMMSCSSWVRLRSLSSSKRLPVLRRGWYQGGRGRGGEHWRAAAPFSLHLALRGQEHVRQRLVRLFLPIRVLLHSARARGGALGAAEICAATYLNGCACGKGGFEVVTAFRGACRGQSANIWPPRRAACGRAVGRQASAAAPFARHGGAAAGGALVPLPRTGGRLRAWRLGKAHSREQDYWFTIREPSLALQRGGIVRGEGCRGPPVGTGRAGGRRRRLRRRAFGKARAVSPLGVASCAPRQCGARALSSSAGHTWRRHRGSGFDC